MNKLLIIVPHLSTGGLPQFVLKKVQLLNDTYDIFIVEWNCLSLEYTIQREEIIKLLKPPNFKSLPANKGTILNIIKDFNPQTIWIEEFSEQFIEGNICKEIYSSTRTYSIIETTHSSLLQDKEFIPDKFIFVSKYSMRQYDQLNAPQTLIQYPINYKISTKKIPLAPEYKYVLNVGLFTPGKNQAYAFEIASHFINEKVKFLFIGNTADNFRNYWESLLNNKPDNCIVLGEKNNVEEYIQSVDAFLFTSKFELNPLVLLECMEYNLPVLCFNLPTYSCKYDNIETFNFLTGDIHLDVNKLKELLK